MNDLTMIKRHKLDKYIPAVLMATTKERDTSSINWSILFLAAMDKILWEIGKRVLSRKRIIEVNKIYSGEES